VRQTCPLGLRRGGPLVPCAHPQGTWACRFCRVGYARFRRCITKAQGPNTRRVLTHISLSAYAPKADRVSVMQPDLDVPFGVRKAAALTIARSVVPDPDHLPPPRSTGRRRSRSEGRRSRSATPGLLYPMNGIPTGQARREGHLQQPCHRTSLPSACRCRAASVKRVGYRDVWCKDHEHRRRDHPAPLGARRSPHRLCRSRGCAI